MGPGPAHPSLTGRLRYGPLRPVITSLLDTLGQVFHIEKNELPR